TGYPKDSKTLGRIKDSVDRGDLVGILDAIKWVSNIADGGFKNNFQKVVTLNQERYKLIKDLRNLLRTTVLVNIIAIVFLLLGLVVSEWMCHSDCGIVFVGMPGLLVV